jgi:signal transduction histidine kinase
MELSEFAAHLTRFIYLAVFVVTLFEYVAHRDETRLDIALMFATFAVTVLAQEYAQITGIQSRWIDLGRSLAIMTQPYLLVRLVGHVRPVPAWVRRTALAGMVVSWVLVVFLPDLPEAARLAATLLLVAYFTWAEGYATLAFVQGARTTGGVTHWRLLLAAMGSGLVAAVILWAGVQAIAMSGGVDLTPYSAGVTQAMGVGSALAFYFGFAAPRWLRHQWQLVELHRFLQAAAGKPALERAEWMLGVLCDSAMRAVGGRGAIAAAWDEAQGKFVVRAATNPAWDMAGLTPQHGTMAAAWQQRQPKLARRLEEMSPDGRRLAEAVGASSMMAVPIGIGETKWGLLVALLRRSPLFPDDDLSLLVLFAEQAAMALEQAALLTEQQGLVEELRARSAQLEATNAELEAFSYSVSHDLRAPLRHIEGFTDLLRREGVPPEQQRLHLQRISEAAIRMGRLIDDLLTFSRMGRAELRRVPLRLDRLLDDVRADLQNETQGREIDWRIRPLPEAQGDPDLLRLVLYNLLSNAVKYTRGRQPAEIEVGSAAGQGNEVVVYVKDNGVGFDMQYVDKLFGVFQRLHHADEFEGVGIGLANVRRIVTRHGGRTWADSRPGQGATFYFSLPGLTHGPGAFAPAGAPARSLTAAPETVGTVT